jgi:hypothetical protein
MLARVTGERATALARILIDMYDASFDHDSETDSARNQRFLWALRFAAIAAVILAASAGAQIPGLPVLQNVWASPGVVGALDIGGGSDGTTYAGAIGWTPGSGRFQLSAGVGARTRKAGGSGASYGARVAMPFGGASSTFGFAAFAGIGGGPAVSTPASTISFNNGNAVTVPDSVSSTTEVPLGAAIGWRRAIGSNHGISVYADPAYVLFSGGSKTQGLFRAAVGVDVGITNSLGATVGVEFGGTRARGFGGPSGTQFGVGVSYAFGKR